MIYSFKMNIVFRNGCKSVKVLILKKTPKRQATPARGATSPLTPALLAWFPKNGPLPY